LAGSRGQRPAFLRDLERAASMKITQVLTNSKQQAAAAQVW
jgi:hypothetical protein